jgi:hypothetical protein
MTDLPDLKIKALVNFPANAFDGVGVNIRKENGNYYADLDYSDFATVASIPPADIPNSYVLVFNNITGAFVLVPISTLTNP